jgi:cyclic beta-1,2-glucan synthetase
MQGDERARQSLLAMPSLAELPHSCEAAALFHTGRRDETPAQRAVHGAEPAAIDALLAALVRSGHAATSLERRLTMLAERAATMFEAMKFDFLFEPERQLLSIGYRVADSTLDPNCYDLLASEARLTSFIAIAKGDIPTRHWFRFGPPLPRFTAAPRHFRSGSMFEYPAPSLSRADRQPAEQTSCPVVRRQIDYAPSAACPGK